MEGEEEKWKLRVVLGNKVRKKKRLEGELATINAEIEGLKQKLGEN
jgi:hypothetical protein